MDIFSNTLDRFLVGTHQQMIQTNKSQFIKNTEIKAKLVSLESTNKDLDILKKQTYQFILTDLKPLTTLIERKIFWANLLNKLNQSIPSKAIWITELKPIFKLTNPHELIIRGLYIPLEPTRDLVVDEFAQRLSKTSLFQIGASGFKPFILHKELPNLNAWTFSYELKFAFKETSNLF